MLAVEKQTGKRPRALRIEPPPQELAYLWGLFCEVRRGESLTFSELESWSRMTRRALSGFEVDALMRLDAEVARALQ